MSLNRLLNQGCHRIPAHCVLAMFAIGAACVLPGCQATAPHMSTVHKVALVNRAAMAPVSTDAVITARRTLDGDPVEYSTEVRSVYCLDEECEIVTVRMYWGPLGAYRRYEVPADKKLTKNEHVAFSKADHRILHELLMDRHSQAKRVNPQELLKAEREQLGGKESPRQFLWRNPEYALGRADAVSTPTPIDLKSVLVPGAAYTSLTLWNWANGELVDHVRAITRDTSSRERLLEWIADKDPDRVRFALDTLVHRQIFDQEVVAAVLNRSEEKDGDWIRAAWPYLVAATPDRPGRRNVYLTLMTHSTSTQRPFLLERLIEEQQVPEDWFEPLSRFLGDCETHYEVHLFLNLLSNHQVRDARVIQRVAPLRNDPNAFIARRVDRFLRDQPRITLPSASGRNPS